MVRGTLWRGACWGQTCMVALECRLSRRAVQDISWRLEVMGYLTPPAQDEEAGQWSQSLALEAMRQGVVR